MPYITEALRWGDRENHSYVVGVYSTKELATLAGPQKRLGGVGSMSVLSIDLRKING